LHGFYYGKKSLPAVKSFAVAHFALLVGLFPSSFCKHAFFPGPNISPLEQNGLS
jgi:hypothetical protein